MKQSIVKQASVAGEMAQRLRELLLSQNQSPGQVAHSDL